MRKDERERKRAREEAVNAEKRAGVRGKTFSALPKLPQLAHRSLGSFRSHSKIAVGFPQMNLGRHRILPLISI